MRKLRSRESNNSSKVTWLVVKVKVTRLCLTLCDPIDYTVHGILQARILEWVTFTFSRGYSHPGIRPRFPTLQADSLPAEPQGKPKNTGVGSLLLLQWIFPTQESNQGLLHCRQILYQLSYQESPTWLVAQSLSHVRLFVTLWTASYQGSMSFTISQRLLRLMSTM